MPAIHPRIAEKQSELEVLCRKHHVRRLELFGSAADGRFDPERSDFDFLLELEPLPPAKYADAYFGLLEALETLLAAHVDLVMTRAIHNRYFLESINRTRTLLYAA